MSLLDDVIVNAAAAVNAVGKKAEEVVDRSKLRVSSADLRRRISLKYETLGRYVFDTTTAGTMDSEVVGQYTKEIAELIDELKAIQDILHADEQQNTCPRCSCVNPTDSLYCRKCGVSLDFTNSYTAKKEVADAPAEAVSTCEEVKDESAQEISLDKDITE